MPEERSDQAALLDIFLSFDDALGETGDRHTYVCDHDLRVRAVRLVGPEHIVAGLPEPGAVLGFRAPFERTTAELQNHISKALGLLLDGSLATMELQKQCRLDGKIELGVRIADGDLLLIDQLNARQRYARLNGHDGRVAGGIDAREATNTASNRFRDGMQSKG